MRPGLSSNVAQDKKKTMRHRAGLLEGQMLSNLGASCIGRRDGHAAVGAEACKLIQHQWIERIFSQYSQNAAKSVLTDSMFRSARPSSGRKNKTQRFI